MTETFVPSEFQRAIYEDVRSGTGHTIIEACAGSGKTTTLLAALAHVPKGCTVAFFAFARAIASTLSERAPKGVRVSTLHSHGLWTLGQSELRFEGLTKDKTTVLATMLWGAPPGRDHPVFDHYKMLSALLDKAKDTLTPAEAGALDELVDRFGIEAPPDKLYHPEICSQCDRRVAEAEKADSLCDSGGRKHVFPSLRDCVRRRDGTYEDMRTPRQLFVEAAVKLLKLSAKRTDMVDFGDMCWLPIQLDLDPPQYDRVFVDEVQDLSPVQIAFMLRCVKPGGRFCVIGDSRQSLFKFRGADEDTIDKLKETLSARVLTLPVSYRCARAIVALAAQEVPAIVAALGAPEGVVSFPSLRELAREARRGDFVISRSNAPLVGIWFRLVAQKKPAVILGRSDEVFALLAFIRGFRCASVPELLSLVEGWRNAERLRLEMKGRSCDWVDDQYASVVAITRGCLTVREATGRVRDMFADPEKVDRSQFVVLGTTHKLKGLEAERVWMLDYTYSRTKREEANCFYVAVTRAKTTLFVTEWADDEGGN